MSLVDCFNPETSNEMAAKNENLQIVKNGEMVYVQIPEIDEEDNILLLGL